MHHLQIDFGIYSLKWELEDLAFKYLYPEDFREIVEGIDKKREERLQFIEKIQQQIIDELKKQKIDAEIEVRLAQLGLRKAIGILGRP